MKKFLDANGVSKLYSSLSLQDYPNNETLVSVINAIDETKADKTYVDEKIGWAPKHYSNPTSVPITSGTQVVAYAAAAGDLTFTLGNASYTYHLDNANSTFWGMWVQTDEQAGSFIFPSQERKYFLTGSIVDTLEISYEKTGSSNTYAYIVITIS